MNETITTIKVTTMAMSNNITLYRKRKNKKIILVATYFTQNLKVCTMVLHTLNYFLEIHTRIHDFTLFVLDSENCCGFREVFY